MESSTELLNVVHRFFEVISDRDYSGIEALLSNHEGVVIIGSDPNDWYIGKEAFMNGLKSEFNANPQKVTHEISDAEVYVEGVAGWFAGKVSLVLRNGKRIPFRWTLVFHRNDNNWIITQMHASIAIPNAIIWQVVDSYQ